MKKKALCLLLALLTALTVLPLTAHASAYTVTTVVNGQGRVWFEPADPAPGDTVTVYAAAAEGWVIKNVIFEDSETPFNTVNYFSLSWTEDYNDFVMPEDNVTVTTNFIEEGSAYTVSFDENGGDSWMSPTVVDPGDTYELPECECTREGYTFVKWEIDGEYYDPGDKITVNGNTYVKAIWKKDDSNKIDNSVDASITEVYGKLVLTDPATGIQSESQVCYDFAESEFTNPYNDDVNEMIEAAKLELSNAAGNYSGLSNVGFTVSDPSITLTRDDRTFTNFTDGEGHKYKIVDGEYMHAWQIDVTLTADYTPAATDYFSVWMSDNEQHANTGGGVAITYKLPDGTVPGDSGSFWESSTNQTVPEGSTVTLIAEPYSYLGYRFVGWYQANINKESANDPQYLADKLISAEKEYTFTGNPVGEGAPPYICAVFEDTGIIRQGDQIQVWITDGGKAAVEYTPSEPNTYDMPTMDGTNYVSIGEVVQYYVGDEITVHQQAEEGYVFKGWYHVWIEWGPGSEHPKYEGDAISTDPTFTYKPGVTIVPGDTEPLRYVCAVFEKASGYLLGDADGDGDVSSVDVAVIQRYCAEMDISAYEATIMQADVDGNGYVDIVDAAIIQRYLAQVEILFPVGETVT